jgi:hypothetical protein
MKVKLGFRRALSSIFRIGLLVIFLLLSPLILNVQGAAGNVDNQYYYFPYIVDNGQYCEQDHLVNGNFEQDDFAWQLYSNGWGWKIHDLIGSREEGFSPFKGTYGAELGGYEGVYDYIEQKLVMPNNGQLTYWWKMNTSETPPRTDIFSVDIYEIDHTWVARLEIHDVYDFNGVWQQDVIDLTTFEGRNLILRFSAYNDNYYGTNFYLDEISLCSWYE